MSAHRWRRGALLAVLVLAFWILLAFPEWVGVPVAVIVIVLLSVLGYVLRDRDRLADQLDAAETRRARAEADAVRCAGIAEAERRAREGADAQVRRLTEEVNSAQAKQFAAEAKLQAATWTAEHTVSPTEEAAAAQLVRDIGSSSWPVSGTPQ